MPGLFPKEHFTEMGQLCDLYGFGRISVYDKKKKHKLDLRE